MEDLPIDVVEINSASSRDDPNRVELLWDGRVEDLVVRWLKVCNARSEAHAKAASIAKAKYIALAIPNVLIPVVSSGFVAQLEAYPFAITSSFVLTGVLGAIAGLFEFGKKQQQYNHYSYAYQHIARTIELTLAKPKKRRVAADAYLVQISCDIDRLDESAPDL
jgi:hypothetical protein